MGFIMNATRRHLLAYLAGGALVAAVAPAFADEVIIREHVMPPMRVEVVPAQPPHPGWSWVKGHWRWAPSGWVWVAGHWFEHAVPPMPELIVETPPPPPSPRHFWVRGHWVWDVNHWAWMRGHWVA
jgi:hypothetical protein